MNSLLRETCRGQSERKQRVIADLSGRSGELQGVELSEGILARRTGKTENQHLGRAAKKNPEIRNGEFMRQEGR